VICIVGVFNMVKEMIHLISKKEIAKALHIRVSTLDKIIKGERRLTRKQLEGLRTIRRRLVYNKLRILGIRPMEARRLRDISLKRLRSIEDTLQRIHRANINRLRHEMVQKFMKKVGVRKMRKMLDMLEKDYWENIKKSAMDFEEWLSRYQKYLAEFIGKRVEV